MTDSAGKEGQGVLPGGASWAEAPGLVARGVAMGMADVVPGVSGGTMALILGVYERLIEAIRSVDRTVLSLLLRGRAREALARAHWRFLVLLLAGIAGGIVVFVKGVKLPQLLLDYPDQLYGLFFGLILGSVVVLVRDVGKEGRWGWKLMGVALGGAVCGLLVGQLTRTSTPYEAWFVFLAGMVAICAMILPGISGSFVLLILGQYAYVLGGLGDLLHPESGDRADSWRALLEIVLPFSAGALIGIVSFTRVLSQLLRRARRATLSFMTGLLLGSLWVLWPFQERIYEVVREKRRFVGTHGPQLPEVLDGAALLALGLVAVGVAGVLLLEWLARGRVSKTPR